MLAPSARAREIASRAPAIVATTFMLVAVVGIWISAGPYLFAIALDRFANRACEVVVFLEKFRGELVIQTEKIGKHQYLPIAMRSCADSNRRNRDCLRNSLREI